MMTLEEFEQILSGLCDEIPDSFYEELSGGVNLSPDAKLHPESRADDLYIMGEYQVDSAGKRVVLYYGSFQQAYGNLSDEGLTDRMRKVLRHEFRHHLEGRGGEKALEIEDKIQIMKYKGLI